MENLNKQKEFEEIYKHETDSLFRYCIMRVSDRGQAIDIVQETFIELWRALLRNEEIKNPRAYLFKVLKNRIIDWYRKKKSLSLDKMMEGTGEENIFDPADSNAHTQITYSAEVREVIEAINSLPDGYRDVVYLRLIEDLTPPQIADNLSSNVNIVSIRITRGLKLLKKKFK